MRRLSLLSLGLLGCLLGLSSQADARGRARETVDDHLELAPRRREGRAASGERRRDDEGTARARERDDDAASADDSELVRVTSSRTLEVLARDLRLTEEDAARVRRIARRYHAATKKRLIVTGGRRSPLRQAQLMFDKLKKGEDVGRLYENRKAAGEIADAYRATRDRGASRAATLRAMRDVITAQVARGDLVSRHLSAHAIDVRSRDLGRAQIEAFHDAVAAEPGVRLVDERDGAEPHFHVNLE